MRLLAMSALILLSLRVCEGGDREQAPSPPATPSASMSAQSAASTKAAIGARLGPGLGGTIVTVGDYAVEVLLFHDGRLEAHVTTRDGMLVMHPLKDRVAVTVRGQGGTRQRVQLAWSKPRAHYLGRADTALEPGAIEIDLEVKGRVSKAEFDNAALAYDPVIGGSVLAAGAHTVELTAGVDGAVEAVLRDAAGVELGADAGASLAVDLPVQGATSHVKLAWDAARATWVGRVDAGAKLVPGRVQVELKLDGKSATGGLARFVPQARATHGGRVLMAGDFSVELVSGANGAFQAFVTNLRGEAETQGDLTLMLAVDGRPGVKLEWDAPSLSYRAKLDAGVDLSAKPLRLALDACCGRSAVGAVVGLSADARVRARARAAAAADLGGQGRASAQAGAAPRVGASAEAKASLAAPKPDVGGQVRAPSVNARASTSRSGGTRVGGKAGFSLGTNTKR